MTTGAGGPPVVVPAGRPAAGLTDEELEAQGTRAHATRNWVFLHGTAEQFARHTSRMLELEQEYLRRHPQRTWQRSGGAGTDPRDEAAALREALRAVVAQLDALAVESVRGAAPVPAADDPVLAVLGAVAGAGGGRRHKLEVHQVAREAGLDRTALAALYSGPDPLLRADRHDRVVTAAGRRRLREAGRPDGPGRASGPAGWRWVRDERPTWDAGRERVVGGAEPGVFDLAPQPGAALPGEWWSVQEPDGTPVAYGWMDVTWGEAEVLVAVDPGVRGQGLGAFVLDRLEQEAAARGVNYVHNTVAATHPRREQVQDWLGARGYRGGDDDRSWRKHVRAAVADADTAGAAPGPAPTGGTAVAGTPAPAAAAGSDRGPGREDAGGYVDVEDHRY